MGANNFILALYALSAIMAFACALIPGSGLFGRLLCVFAGLALVLWPASTFVLTGWYNFGIAIAAVPPILLGYGLLTARRYFTTTTWVPGLDETRSVEAAAPTVERRGPGRQALPGEFGDVPVNHAPPSHDPWEALYASQERTRLRGGNGASDASAISGLEQQPATRQAYHGSKPTALTRLAFDTEPPWFLENIDEVSRRDAPHTR